MFLQGVVAFTKVKDVDQVVNQHFTLAWYSAYEAMEMLVVKSVCQTTQFKEHRAIVMVLEKPMRKNMKEMFCVDVDVGKSK